MVNYPTYDLSDYYTKYSELSSDPLHPLINYCTPVSYTHLDVYKRQPQDRVAQMVIMPVLLPEIEEVTELSDTERGEGGFGSTGK